MWTSASPPLPWRRTSSETICSTLSLFLHPSIHPSLLASFSLAVLCSSACGLSTVPRPFWMPYMAALTASRPAGSWLSSSRTSGWRWRTRARSGPGRNRSMWRGRWRSSAQTLPGKTEACANITFTRTELRPRGRRQILLPSLSILNWSINIHCQLKVWRHLTSFVKKPQCNTFQVNQPTNIYWPLHHSHIISVLF